jgi:hypothetical protein
MKVPSPDFLALLRTMVGHGVDFIKEETGHEKDKAVLPILRCTLEEKSKPCTG